jgi:hypothetical protein
MLKTVGFPSTRTGDQTIVGGNLVIGTAGKGIDFSADPSAPGMTSELLDDYEEGTWTASLTGTLTAPTTPVTVTGTYTKIGNQVTASAQFINVDTTGASGELVVAGLPFNVGATNDYHGVAGQNGFGAAVLMCTAFSTSTLLKIRDASTTVFTTVVAGPSKYLLTEITYFV